MLVKVFIIIVVGVLDGGVMFGFEWRLGLWRRRKMGFYYREESYGSYGLDVRGYWGEGVGGECIA